MYKIYMISPSGLIFKVTSLSDMYYFYSYGWILA